MSSSEDENELLSNISSAPVDDPLMLNEKLDEGLADDGE